MNTAKKINSLLSSGAVSVTGPSQPRIFKQKVPNAVQHHQIQVNKQCYVCDEITGQQGTLLTDALTSVTSTKIPNKIGRVVGDAFMVIISVDDIVCKRCMSMFNHMDRLEHDLERVKTNILNLINKKYGITDTGGVTSDSSVNTPSANQPPAIKSSGALLQQPPTKVQRLNTSGTAVTYGNRKTSSSNGGDDDEVTVTRKLTTISSVQNIANQHHRGGGGAVVESQDSQITTNIFDSPPTEKQQPIVSNNTMQIRQQTTITPIQQQQQVLKKTPQPTKIYKCMSCDFKTMDLKQFQPHYETCKQQNAGYRCKICKKLFTNMNALKAHTAEKHSSEYICSICSINYLNESTFKKHMETNHPDVKTIETNPSASLPVPGGKILLFLLLFMYLWMHDYNSFVFIFFIKH